MKELNHRGEVLFFYASWMANGGALIEDSHPEIINLYYKNQTR